MNNSLSESISVFISYAREDAKWLDAVNNHFGSLYRNGTVQSFDDQLLSIGDKWNKVIIDRINTADLIVLLVTATFLSSKYINEVELHYALERHRANQCWLMPIIISDCYWKKQEFAEVQLYPRSRGEDLRPLDEWENVNKPLASITEALDNWAQAKISERKNEQILSIAKAQRQLYAVTDRHSTIFLQQLPPDLVESTMKALRRENIQSADDSAIRVITEAAKLRPAHQRPDGREFDQEISTSRLFIGALNVGKEKLKSNKNDKSWLAGLAKFFDQPDNKVREFNIKNNKRFNDDEAGAPGRLDLGFSPNSRKILQHAIENAGSLRGDAIAFTIMFPRATLLHDWLRGFGINVDDVRNYIEDYTRSDPKMRR